mmetsp:Transcript_21294/g.46213  ORF Transcript_21294/g.46213 Transcript_21294/m.46213 type:complete len:326 (+) Transcript_21294:360-1337(+)
MIPDPTIVNNSKTTKVGSVTVTVTVAATVIWGLLAAATQAATQAAAAAAAAALVLLGVLVALELDGGRAGPTGRGRFSIGGASKGFCVADVGKSALILLHSLSIELVDAGLAAVSEQGLVVDRDLLVRTAVEAAVHAGRLVEETGVELRLVRGGLRGLSQSDTLGNIAILITSALALLAGQLQSLVTLNLALSLVQDLHTLLPILRITGRLALDGVLIRKVRPLLARLSGQLAQLLLSNLLLADLALASHVVPDSDLLSRLTLGQVQIFGKCCELVVYSNILQLTTVGGQTLVQWDGITFSVLPIGDARGDLPIFLILGCQLLGR